MLSAGDHVVVTDDLYGGTYRLFSRVLTRYGLEFTYVDMADMAAVRAAVKPNTKMFWVETPTNPLLKLIDIRAICSLRTGAQIVVVDNTFASPYFQQPLSLGADIVVHSTSKYIGGHSDVVGGAALTSNKDFHDTIKFHQNAVGGVPGPHDAWLTMRGAKTLALRMREHAKNAQAVAEFLEAHSEVDRVYYPGLASHPQHELAKRAHRWVAPPIGRYRRRRRFDRRSRSGAREIAFSRRSRSRRSALGPARARFCFADSRRRSRSQVRPWLALP